MNCTKQSVFELFSTLRSIVTVVLSLLVCLSAAQKRLNRSRCRVAGADPENELGGGQCRGSGGRKSPSGVQGRSPGKGSRRRSPPEADDFSQLKGYLDVLWRDLVTSGILGGMESTPLVSGINSRLPSVNHALISLILPCPVV